MRDTVLASSAAAPTAAVDATIAASASGSACDLASAAAAACPGVSITRSLARPSAAIGRSARRTSGAPYEPSCVTVESGVCASASSSLKPGRVLADAAASRTTAWGRELVYCVAGAGRRG